MFPAFNFFNLYIFYLSQTLCLAICPLWSAHYDYTAHKTAVAVAEGDGRRNENYTVFSGRLLQKSFLQIVLLLERSVNVLIVPF
jgi:hypothetical protein